MRFAAAILLGLAILIVAGTIAFNVMAATEFHELRQNFSNTQMVMSIVLSLENGALPLFGAALLWRLDRRWGGTGKARPLRRAVALHFRSEEHTSELQSLMRISYAVFFWQKKTTNIEYIVLTYTQINK